MKLHYLVPLILTASFVSAEDVIISSGMTVEELNNRLEKDKIKYRKHVINYRNSLELSVSEKSYQIRWLDWGENKSVIEIYVMPDFVVAGNDDREVGIKVDRLILTTVK